MLKWCKKKFDFLKGKLPPVVFNSGLILLMSVAGNLVGCVSGWYVIPKYLTKNELGLCIPLGSFITFGAIPVAVVSTLIIKYITRYEANQEWGKLKQLIRDIVIFGACSVLLVSVVFVLSFDFLFVTRLGVESKNVLFWMLIYLLVSAWGPLVMTLARSTRQFFFVALRGFMTPVVLLLATVILLPRWGLEGYLVALMLSVLAQLIVAFFFVRSYLAPYRSVKRVPYFLDCKDMVKRYLFLFFILSVLGWAWTFLPSFIIKHFLTDQDAAGYYFVYKLAYLPSYLVSPVMMVLLPILSAKHESSQSTSRTVGWTAFYTAVVGFSIVVVLHLFSPFLFKYMSLWREYYEYSKYIWLLAVFFVLRSVSSVYASDLAAKWCFHYNWYKLPFSLFFLGLTYCLFGWGALRKFMPVSLWGYINDVVTPNITLLLCLLILNVLVGLCITIFWHHKFSKEGHVNAVNE